MMIQTDQEAAQELVKVAKIFVGKSEVDIFDSAKKGQVLSIAFTSVMGTGILTDGSYHDWTVGRRAKQKRYNSETITLIPVGMEDKKWDRRNSYRLWKRTNSDTGEAKLSASHGNMGIFIKGIRG